MINLRPAKSVQGKISLPVSPDLLFMATLGACAAGQKITIANVGDTDVIADIVRSLSGLAEITKDAQTLQVSPTSNDNDPAQLLTLPESLLPYRALYMFMGLGMGKTVVSKSLSPRQLEDFIAQAKRIGIAAESVALDNMTGLCVRNFDDDIASGSYPNEDDCNALLAYLFGARKKLTFPIVDFHLSSPLRQLANAFSFTLNVKQTSNTDDSDPLAKRMRFLKSKQQRDAKTSSIAYTIDADFSASANADGVTEITLPGDDILAAALITLKCLVQKGELEISNVSVEPWASQTLSLIKKMGCKPNISGECKTTFGTSATVSIPKSIFAGRKTRCTPFYQYAGQLPCMCVVSAFAEGKSVFRELDALRLFDPDGLDQLEKCLRPLGIRHGEMPDGIVLEGAKEFDGFDMPEPLPAHIAVAFCIAGLKCVGKTSINDELIISRLPQFENMLNEICEFRGKQ